MYLLSMIDKHIIHILTNNNNADIHTCTYTQASAHIHNTLNKVFNKERQKAQVLWEAIRSLRADVSLLMMDEIDC